jgi:hypothetical protein
MLKDAAGAVSGHRDRSLRVHVGVEPGAYAQLVKQEWDRSYPGAASAAPSRVLIISCSVEVEGAGSTK